MSTVTEDLMAARTLRWTPSGPTLEVGLSQCSTTTLPPPTHADILALFDRAIAASRPSSDQGGRG